MFRRVAVFLVLVSATAVGQISSSSSSVTVTAALGQNVSPDQVTFSAVVQSGPTLTLDDILGALQGTGLTAATFSNVASVDQYVVAGNPANQPLVWTFTLTVPLANLKSEVAALQGLATTLSQAQTPLQLSFTVSGPQVSTQAQVQSCSLADLVAAARTKAQLIAGAANRNAGGVTALSASVSTMIGPSAVMPYVVPGCTLTATFGGTQPGGNSITVVASRTVNVPPDLAIIAVYVSTAAGTTLNDAVAALSGTGVAAGNLVNVYANSQAGPLALAWQFSIAVPFSQLKDTIAALVKVSSPAVSFWVQGTQVSAQLLAAQDCSYASLLADAQAQARKVTAAAQVSLNDVMAISDSGLSVPLVRQGNFSQFVSGAIYATLAPFPPQNLTCSLVAQFGIGQ